MKLIYLRPFYWFDLKAGGSVGHTAGVINAFQKKLELEVLSSTELPEVSCKPEIIEPVFFSLLPKWISEIIYNFKVIKYCKNKKADAIYQRYNGFSFCGAFLAKKKNIPFILEFNSSNVWRMKNWKIRDEKKNLSEQIRLLYETCLKLPVVMQIENYNIKNAHKIVVVSKALKEVLKSFGVNDNKIIVIPNGVDELKYCPDLEDYDIRKEYGLKDKIIIGFIGTFGHWHGAENIALAYGMLIQKYPEYKDKTILFMIGDGIKMNEVKNHIKNFNIFENVILTGLVPQKEGPKYLSVCDILVNSTVPNPDGTEFFGSPTKIFEYMAMGKGIICSDMGQMSEILEHKETALMVKPGDIEDLLESMKILIDNESLRKEMGKNARACVMKKYTWDKHVDQILSNIV